MSVKQAMNDKLQGSVAIYLRCAGVINNQIRKGLLLSVSEFFFKPVNIWQSYKQERDCVMHFLHLVGHVGLPQNPLGVFGYLRVYPNLATNES